MFIYRPATIFLCLLGLSSVLYAAEPQRRGLFVSVIQDPVVLNDRAAVETLIADAKASRIDTLFVQVYRGNQAWFESGTADPAPYRAALKKVGSDPLKLLIARAHAERIEVHAWMNLLSLSANDKALILKKYGHGILTRTLGDKGAVEEYKVDKQYFLEPGDPRVRGELTAIVGELVRGYPELDGVQFDYIRYPDTDPDFGVTNTNVRRYKKATGNPVVAMKSEAWKDWKREQVSSLVKNLGNAARRIRPGIHISTTGLMPYSRASREAYQDWKLWVKSGLVDFVTLMCYTRDADEFRKMVENGRENAGDLSRVNIAVGAYALGESPETFKREWDLCEDSGARACVMLGYGDFKKLKKALSP